MESDGRGRSERRQTPCTGCPSPPRGALTRSGAGRCLGKERPQTRRGRTGTGEREARNRGIEGEDFSSLSLNLHSISSHQQENPPPPFVLPSRLRLLLREACRVQLQALWFL